MKLPIIEKESDGLLSKGAIISASQQEKLCSSTVIASQTSCHEKPVINLKQFIHSMPYQNSKMEGFLCLRETLLETTTCAYWI